MRLTCPNCGARYEVDDALIPAEGRDVQCSDCFTTWFQAGPRRPMQAPPAPRPPYPQEAEEAVEPDGAPDAGAPQDTETFARPEPEPRPETGVDRATDEPEAARAEPEGPPAEPEEAPETPEVEPTVQVAPDEARAEAEPAVPVAEAGDEPRADGLTGIPEDAETATRVVAENEEPDLPEEERTVASDPVAGRREIDPGVRDILRSEAEREARLRKAAADPVETQAEMPLEESPADANRARRRSELEGAEEAYTVAAASAAHANGSRRDLLPDIEEINSTLRATEDRGGDVSDEAVALRRAAEARRRRGVRLGFLLTLAVTAGLIWLYLNADMVVQRVPALAGPVTGFSAQVDGARFWLDDLARGLAASGEES